jgi:hypothetical protein
MSVIAIGLATAACIRLAMPQQFRWARPARCASRDRFIQHGHNLGGPTVRAAFGGNLSLPGLPRKVMQI